MSRSSALDDSSTPANAASSDPDSQEIESWHIMSPPSLDALDEAVSSQGDDEETLCLEPLDSSEGALLPSPCRAGMRRAEAPPADEPAAVRPRLENNFAGDAEDSCSDSMGSDTPGPSQDGVSDTGISDEHFLEEGDGEEVIDPNLGYNEFDSIMQHPDLARDPMVTVFADIQRSYNNLIASEDVGSRPPSWVFYLESCLEECGVALQEMLDYMRAQRALLSGNPQGDF